jgi:alpha-tubulin suppressor-like RCC1 family protein
MAWRQRGVAECYVSEERLKRLRQKTTNVYVWGEGQQVDIQQDYSNYSPKNLKPFKGKGMPNVVDVAFGWYHEAYLDAQGKLYVCRKPKLASIKVEEIDEKDREGLVELSEKLPGKPRLR